MPRSHTSNGAHSVLFSPSETVFQDIGLHTGGDLGVTGGRSPKNFEVGAGPCIRLLNILRTIVIGCEEKYELTKKWVCMRKFGLLNRSFW